MPMRLGMLASIVVLAATLPLHAQSSNPFAALFSANTSGASATNPFAAAPSGAASVGATTLSTSSSSSLSSIFSATMSNKQSSAPMMQKANLPSWSMTNFLPTHALFNGQNTMLGRTNGTPAPAVQTLVVTSRTPRPHSSMWAFWPFNKK